MATGPGVLQYPCAEDALAEIASEEGEAIAVLVGSMQRLWSWVLIQDFVRPN
jgi:hypothetical protein